MGFDTVKLKLRNTTENNEAIGAGTLVAVAKFHRNGCYTDDLAGEPLLGATSPPCSIYRTRDEEIVVSSELPITGLDATTAQQFVFTFDKPIPINATDLFLQVVFKGQLGSETGAVVVATKDTFEPTYLAFINNTDEILFNGTFYPTPSPALLPTLDANHDGVIDSIYDKTPLTVYFGFGGQFLGWVTSLPPGRYSRVALLTERNPYSIKSAALGNAYTFPTNTANFRPEVNQLNPADGIYYLEGLRMIRGVPMFNDIIH